MGFKGTKLINLEFEDPELKGLVVQTRGVATGLVLPIAGFMEELDKDGAEFTPEDMRKISEVFDVFAQALIKWNMEDLDDKPIPATREGIGQVDLELMLAIAMAWLQTIFGVSEDLGKDSSSGEPSLEASLPMEPLSQSLAS